MFQALSRLARRRPVLVVLAVLYPSITVLVARSSLTVALCTALLLSVVVQVTLALRRTDARVPDAPRPGARS